MTRVRPPARIVPTRTVEVEIPKSLTDADLQDLLGALQWTAAQRAREEARLLSCVEVLAAHQEAR